MVENALLFFVILVLMIGSLFAAIAGIHHASFGTAATRAIAQRYRPIIHFPGEGDAFVFPGHAKRYIRAMILLSTNSTVYGILQDAEKAPNVYVCEYAETCDDAHTFTLKSNDSAMAACIMKEILTVEDQTDYDTIMQAVEWHAQNFPDMSVHIDANLYLSLNK